ncbi:MAG: hypothetical protein ACHQ2Z_04455 [Elusimicrobiota bacterium]
MKRLILVFTMLSAAGCRKAPASTKRDFPIPTRAVVAGVPLVDYDSASGEFSCRAPGEWRTLEDKTSGPRAMFFGPGSAKYPRSVSISILRYPDVGQIKTPKQYWDSLKISGQEPSPLETREIEGRIVYALHYDRAQRPLHGYKVLYMRREDVIMLPVKDGFFAISHSAPAETYTDTLPVFEAVVSSFRPKT